MVNLLLPYKFALRPYYSKGNLLPSSPQYSKGPLLRLVLVLEPAQMLMPFRIVGHLAPNLQELNLDLDMHMHLKLLPLPGSVADLIESGTRSPL